MYRQARLLPLAQLNLREAEFVKQFNVPALVFSTEASDDSTVESDIRFMKKPSQSETDINITDIEDGIREEINNSRIFFLFKSTRNAEKEIIIGRGSNNDVTINIGLISKTHAKIKLDGGKWYIMDAGSTNGTILNNLRLEAKKWEVLSDNYKIVFGGEVTCKFYSPSGLWSYVNLYRGLKLSTGLLF